METQRIKLSETEVANAIEVLAGRQEGNKRDADILIKSIIKGSDLDAEMPKGFDLKQFQICKCQMPAKVKGKNQCWRCKKRLT